MDLKDVLYDKRDHIVTITLNRPDRMNTLGGTLQEDLDDALREAEADSDARVVVLTGAGKAFCAGLDLKERVKEDPGTRPYRLRGTETPRIALNMNTPIVGAINGPAVGWGFEVALLCDYRIGTERARMGDVHVKRGLVQDAAAMITLPRIVGWSKAARVLLTGEVLDAQELYDIGVLNELVPEDKLMDAAWSFARRIACNAPLAVQMTKRLMRMASPNQLDSVLDYSMMLMVGLQKTEDFQEGMKSFLEKREPEFQGR